MVRRIIENAWNSYKKNFWPVVGAQAAYFAIIFVIFFVSIIPLISAGVSMFGMSGVPLSRLMELAVLPSIAFLTGMVILGIIAIALDTGRIGIFADALKGKQAKVETMFSVAKAKVWTSVGATLIIAAIIGALALALTFMSGLLYAANPLVSGLAILISIVIVVMTVPLFILVKQAIVIDNLRAVDAVKKSYATVSDNYGSFFILVLTYIILIALTSLIPVIGQLVIFFVLQPVIELAYTGFYMAATGRNAAIKEGAEEEEAHGTEIEGKTREGKVTGEEKAISKKKMAPKKKNAARRTKSKKKKKSSR